MGCLKLSYRGQGEGVEENASSILWEVYKKGGSGSKKGVEYYRYGFQGEFAEEDSETGWNSFEARSWDPVVSRWISPDPARQFWSPYMGMANNPMNQVDPDGRYSKFGAMWRSLFHPGSTVIPIGQSGKDYALLFDNGDGTFNSFHEGRIVFDVNPKHFEGLGAEVGFSVKFTMGTQSLKDYGLAGYTADLGSVTLLELSPRLSFEYGRGFSDSRLGFHYAGQNGMVKFSQGGSFEGFGDYKGSVDYVYNQNTGSFTKVATHVGVGAPWVEAKYSHDNIHGGGLLRVGLQEDKSGSLSTGTGQSFGLKGSLNAQMTFRNKWR
ncbi:MAG: RHS repeat-associated core domain-containing protein [Bacteroidota bacterium]